MRGDPEGLAGHGVERCARQVELRPQRQPARCRHECALERPGGSRALGVVRHPARDLREAVAPRFGRQGQAAPTLRDVLTRRAFAELCPGLAEEPRHRALPHARHGVGGILFLERRRAVRALRAPTRGAAPEDPLHPEGPEPFLSELLGEPRRVGRGLESLDGQPRRILMVPVVARRRRGAHGDDHLGPRQADDTDHLLEDRLVPPDPLGERRADRVIEIDGVEVVDVLDQRPPDRAPLLRLPQEPQLGALLEADRVAATLATRDRDHAGLEPVVLVPLAQGGQGPRFVIRVSPDEEDIEVDRSLLGRCARSRAPSGPPPEEQRDGQPCPRALHEVPRSWPTRHLVDKRAPARVASRRHRPASEMRP